MKNYKWQKKRGGGDEVFQFIIKNCCQQFTFKQAGTVHPSPPHVLTFYAHIFLLLLMPFLSHLFSLSKKRKIVF